MKKLFSFLVLFTALFTLTACTEDTTITDSINDLNTIVDDLTAEDTVLNSSISNLQSSLEALQTSVTNLENVDTDTQAVVDQVLADIVTIQSQITALETLSGDNEDTIASIDVLVQNLQTQIDLLQDTVNELHVEKLPFLKQTEIILVHTNDVHGRVNDNSWSGTMGMATIKNIIDEIDSQYDNTMLIDAGDMFHGTTFATLEEGESVLNVMNYVGYDLMVPGNHDFDYGSNRLLELEALADFPIISANIQYKEDGSNFLNPYIIQDFDGVKVGFFGLTSPETLYKTHPDNVSTLNFLDPIDQAELMVEELGPQVDVLVLVAHIGLDASTEITTADIAEEVDGIDVIIDGHSHTTLEHGLTVNDTLIVSTGEYMKNLGILSIVVQGGQVVAKNSTLISSDYAAELGYGYDEDVQAYIDSIEANQEIILGEVIGQTSVILDGERANVRTGETNLGNLIADSMIDVSGADIAITNGGGIRASIPVGDVTVGDIITVLPFGNIIVTKELTGQQIVDALEYGTSDYPEAEGKFPHVSGITFDIDLSLPVGERVVNVMVDGLPIDLGATYVVATNDFLAAGGDGYEQFALVPTAAEFSGLHEALATKFTVGEDVVLPTMGRINVINPLVNVATAQTYAANSTVFVEGVVTSILPDGTFTIEDSDGTALYIDDWDNEIDFSTLSIQVGDLVNVRGAISNYNNLLFVDTVSRVVVVSSGNAITDPIVVTDMAAFRTNITPADFGKRYTFTNVTILDVGYYAYFYEPTVGENRMGIVVDYSDDSLTFIAEDIVTFTATLYGTNGDYTDITTILRFSVTKASDYVVVTPAP